MTVPSFDGSQYRREVLNQLRERNPAEVDDVFWLSFVPRELDDPQTITARLRESKSFLNKERTRARQAAVASALLKEWPRIEATLTDAGARRALLERLGSAPQQAVQPPPATRRRITGSEDPDARRRRQVVANLKELARLRDDPELAADLFVFLGLATSAPREIIASRLARVSEVNRRRRPDRERTLVDELLVQARQLLIEGDVATYLASFGTEACDAAVDALLGGDVAGAARCRARAREHGVSDAAILAGLVEPAGRSSSVVPVSGLGLGIWCPSCRAIAQAGDAHCPGCAASLHLGCEKCRTVNLADAVCCGSCGASMDGPRQALAPGRRVESVPPAPPTPSPVTLMITEREVRLTWPKSADPTVDAYLVERHDRSSTRVLGRTTMTTWTDGQGTAPGVTWTVRALRGELAASPPAIAVPGGVPTPPPAASGSLADVRARGGKAIELSWTAPPGATVTVIRVERRDEGDVQRRLSVDSNGYRDRQVGQGRTYEYRVSIVGRAEPPAVLVVTAGSGENVTPGSRAAAPSRRSAATSAPTPGPVVDDVSASRDPDGRLRVRWRWPAGITEAWVAYAGSPPRAATQPGRKVTNVRYELDGGALLDDTPPGTHLAVFAGRRDAGGTLHWGPAQQRSRAVAP